ncbi:MAG: sigma-70 family RNA polymerase sigma factor [Planctomycetota bacterium]|nr:sigma-70 family RNA polymerase sigma factor [Planctomycetota bacterium]
MDAPSTHATLLARLREGDDPVAWRDFCDQYGELISGFARRWNFQPADRDDVVQEVLSRLSQSMPSFVYDSSRGTFRGYLKTIASNIIRDKLRQKQARGSVQPMDTRAEALESDDSIDVAWEQEWRHYHMRRAMMCLESEFNESDRLAFERYAIEGQDVKQVAQELGMSLDQVYQAKSRIVKRLSAIIEMQVAEEG